MLLVRAKGQKGQDMRVRSKKPRVGALVGVGIRIKCEPDLKGRGGGGLEQSRFSRMICTFSI